MVERDTMSASPSPLLRPGRPLPLLISAASCLTVRPSPHTFWPVSEAPLEITVGPLLRQPAAIVAKAAGKA